MVGGPRGVRPFFELCKIVNTAMHKKILPQCKKLLNLNLNEKHFVE